MKNTNSKFSKKNIVALLLVIFFLINIIAIVVPVLFVNAEADVTVMYNNSKLTADVSPVIYNDRVLVPVRMIFEAIDAEVKWNEVTKKVTINNQNDNIVFTINSDMAYINDKSYQLDTAAKIISNRTFIPIRFLAENSGLDVSWSDEERTVYLKDKVSQNNKEEIDYAYLTDIDINENSISAEFDKDIEYNKMILEDPLRLVIDISDCIKDTEVDTDTDSEYFENFRYAQFSTDPMVTRLVIELIEDIEYEVNYEDKILTVIFGDEITEEDTDNEPDKKLKTVVLDAGHGGKDPGAVGTEDGVIVLKEKDVNLDIALRVYKKLKKEKVNVYITRTTDVFLELSEITEFANSKNADLFVSVHNNAAESTKLSGTMTMYAYDEPKEGYELSGKEVAKIIQKHLVKATDAHDYGPTKNSALYVVRKTNMPAVITESLFVTNAEDRAKLMDEEYIEAIANAIYEGICEVLDL